MHTDDVNTIGGPKTQGRSIHALEMSLKCMAQD